MASPNPVYDDDQDEGSKLSALERAQKSWGMPSTASENDDTSATGGGEAASDEASALDRAKNRWGEAGVVDGEKDKGSKEQGDEKDFAPNIGAADNKKKRGFRSLLSRKNAAIATVAGGGIVGVAMAAIVALPGFVITNLRELILNRISEVQTSQSRNYRRTKIARVSDMFSVDGRRGGKIIAEMERAGYTFHFDPDNRNRITGITLPGKNTSIPNITGTSALADHIEGYMEVRHPLRTSRWKTKRMNAFYDRYGVSRVSVVNRASTDLDTPDKTVNRNLAGSIMEDDYNPTVSGEEPAVDGESEADAQARATRNAEKTEIASNTGGYDDLKTELTTNGTDLDDIPSDIARTADMVGEGVHPDLHRMAQNVWSNQGSLAGKVWNNIKSFGSSLDVADKICIVKKRLRTAVVAARSVRSVSMLKYAAAFVGVSDDIRTNNGDSKLISSVMRRVTANDKNGNPIGASPGFAYALKGKFSKTKNSDFKGTYGVDGKLSGVYKGIQDETNKIPGTGAQACSVYQNPFVQAGTAILEIGIGIFSGGSSTAVTTGTKTTVSTAIKESMQRVITRSFAKSLARSVAIGAAVELSFEGIMSLTQIYAEKTLSMNFTGQEEGATLGGILVGGGGSLNKQRSLAAGFVPATTTQYAQAESEYFAWKKEEMKQQSIFARVFDINNPDSFAFNATAQLAFSTPSSIQGVGSFVSNIAGSLNPMQLLASTFRSLTPSAYAQDADEVSFDTYTTEGDNSGIDLATDPAGNLLPTLPSYISNIDPIENIDYLANNMHIDRDTLEPTSEIFKKHLENCVYGVDILSMIEWGNRNDPAEDCLAEQDLTRRFKAHLAYIDMLDGIDAMLFPEEIDEGGSTGNTAIPSDGLAWPLIQSKSAATSNLGSCLNEAQQSICHAGHPYLAHDLFAEPGTQVVAVAKGEVISAHVGGCGHGFGSAFAVQVFDSESNTTYFYQHMDPNAGGVTVGTIVKPGDPIGKVGSTLAACNTSPHLHMDALSGRGRAACSRLSCSAEVKARFIDISKGLFKGYEVLP